jgi:NADH dehydrogenase (ubiquinone) 1 beta subcomplex subunit 8
VHEDNDIMGVFSLEDYTHMTTARASLCWAVFIASIYGVYYAVKATYPDRPSVPKEYEGGLDKELGGPGALRVSLTSVTDYTMLIRHRPGKLGMS